MPNQTTYNNKATSTVVYYYPNGLQGGGGGGDDECGCHFISVVPTAQDLAYVQADELDIAFITNMTSNVPNPRGVDIAVYSNGSWIIQPTKGEQGVQGPKGPPGPSGAPGAPGAPGANGAPGTNGTTPNHQWIGTSLRFETYPGVWGIAVDLRGPAGTPGTNGATGATGLPPEHSWSGTQLRFKNPAGTWGSYVELRGPQGPPGVDGTLGAIPAHEWSGTQLRFQTVSGWGSYVDLKGEQGQPGAPGPQGDPGLDATGNLQKIVNLTSTSNYTVDIADNNFVIILDIGTNNVTVTIPALLSNNMNVGFIQRGTGNVQFISDGVSIINSHLNHKRLTGNFACCFIEKIGTTSEYILAGSLKT